MTCAKDSMEKLVASMYTAVSKHVPSHGAGYAEVGILLKKAPFLQATFVVAPTRKTSARVLSRGRRAVVATSVST